MRGLINNHYKGKPSALKLPHT